MITTQPMEALTTFKTIDLRPGEILFAEGRCLTGVFRVEQGRLLLRKTDRLGRTVVTRILGPRAWLGGEALADAPAGTTALAATTSVVTAHPPDTLDAASIRELATSLARQSGRLETRLRDFALQTSRSRVAGVLSDLAVEPNQGNGAPTVYPELSRQDLAAVAGMTPETFIRVLSSFRAKGLVRADGRRIELLDPTRLRSIAGR